MNLKPIMGVLIVLMLFLVGGCWDRKEIDDVAIMVAIGVDKDTGKKFKVFTQVIRPGKVGQAGSEGSRGKKESGPESVWVAGTTGVTLSDAYRRLSVQSSRFFFAADNQVIIFGPTLAAEGIAPTMDFFTREYQQRRRVLILIAQDEVKDILKGNPNQENIPALEIREVAMRAYDFSRVDLVKINDLLYMLSTEGRDPVVPIIELRKDQQGFFIQSMGIFKGDRMAGKLTQAESRGYLWITGKAQRGSLAIKTPGDERNFVTLSITRAKSKIEPLIKEGEIFINITIDEEAELVEDLSANKLSPQRFKLLEQRQALVIKNEALAAIRKAQKVKADIFGFGEAVHRSYPKEWRKLKENWNDIFPNLKVNIKVITKLRRSGLTYDPLKVNKY